MSARRLQLGADDAGRMTGCADILIADGSPHDADILEEILIDTGFAGDVHKVDDGVQAMDFLGRVGVFVNAPRPSLILLDVELSEMSGRETLHAIREDPQLQKIPVVLCLSPDAGSLMASDLTGLTGYLMKPAAFHGYLEVVKTLVSFWDRANS